MFNKALRSLVTFAPVVILMAACVAQDPPAKRVRPTEPDSINATLNRADAELRQGNAGAARRIATEVAGELSGDPHRLETADILLRSGAVKQAVDLFDAHIKSRPQSKPFLWQRGIALFFVQRYADGAEQFEVHRSVNPNDVENAAWHFLCVAKDDSPDKARQLVLPAPGDPRIPMEEVLAMLRHGRTQPVIERMESLPPGSTARRSAEFYGHFYLGLYADALGDAQQAKSHLRQAVEHADRNYMGDVARVYAKHLAEQADGDADSN